MGMPDDGYGKDRMWLVRTVEANSSRITGVEEKLTKMLLEVKGELSQMRGEVSTLVDLKRAELSELMKVRAGGKESGVLKDVLIAVISGGAVVVVAVISGVFGLLK